MIVYSHMSQCGKLVQIRGTVFESTMIPALISALITFLGHLAHERGYFDATQISLEMWKVMMFPMGFLLVLRSNQAYARYQQAVDHYVHMMTAANQLCRQVCAYCVLDEEGNKMEMTRPGSHPRAGQASCDDPARADIMRHCIAFLAAVRQDLRLERVDVPDTLVDLNLHVTVEELVYLEQAGVLNRDVNTPYIIARWLTHDVASILHRIPSAPLGTRLELNVQEMVAAYSGIWKISNHPVPWPYTHLAQILLLIWVYTLPLPLLGIYPAYMAVAVAPLVTMVLLGIDAVAREIQDPFGFDRNDLNIYGYENELIENMNTICDGEFQLTTACEFGPASHGVQSSAGTAHHRDIGRMKNVQRSAAQETHGTHDRENRVFLTNNPFSQRGRYSEGHLGGKDVLINDFDSPRYAPNAADVVDEDAIIPTGSHSDL